MNRIVLSLSGAVLAIGLLSGCSTAKSEAMVPRSFTTEQKHASSVNVSTPDQGSDAAWTSQIRSSNFQEAVNLSIQKSGVFATVLKTPDADYSLQVSLVKADEPAFGFNMTVDLVTRWVLTKKASNEPLFQQNVSTTHTAKLGDAFAGGTRLRLANEGAAQANIKEGLRRLSQLKL
jgi:hypothetical protein